MVGLILRFPKMVVMHNPRLTMTYWILQTGAVSFIIWWLATVQPWHTVESMERYIGSSMRVLPTSLDSSLWVQNQPTQFCTDDSSNSSAGHAPCVRPCLPGRYGGGCLPSDDAYYNEDAEMFLVTHVQETTTSSDGELLERDYFVPFIDNFIVGLNYFYDLPVGHMMGGLPEAESFAKRVRASSLQNIRTVLLGNEGQELRTVEAGVEIQISVKELLDMAGQTGQIDMPNPMAWQSDGQVPTSRRSGLELALHIDCFPSLGFGDSLGEDATCSVAVSRTQNGWTERQQRDVLGPNWHRRVRELHGIRIKRVAGGASTSFSVTALVSTMTSILVLLALPQQLTMTICTFCLGHLSNVYRQVLYQTFHLRTFVGGVSLRLLVANTAFVTLMDQKQPGGAGTISRNRFHERLKAVLSQRSSDLDSSEVESIAEFCLMAVHNDQISGPVQAVFNELLQAVVVRSRALVECDHIDSDSFSSVCTSNESVDFNTVITLLDQDRKRRFLERLFTPYSFRLNKLKKRSMSSADSSDTLGIACAGDSELPLKVQSLRRSSSLEEEWEQRERSQQRLQNLQNELNDFDVRSSLDRVESLQKQVAALEASQLHYVGFNELQTVKHAALEREETVERLQRKIADIEVSQLNRVAVQEVEALQRKVADIEVSQQNRAAVQEVEALREATLERQADVQLLQERLDAFEAAQRSGVEAVARLQELHKATLDKQHGVTGIAEKFLSLNESYTDLQKCHESIMGQFQQQLQKVQDEQQQPLARLRAQDSTLQRLCERVYQIEQVLQKSEGRRGSHVTLQHMPMDKSTLSSSSAWANNLPIERKSMPTRKRGTFEHSAGQSRETSRSCDTTKFRTGGNS